MNGIGTKGKAKNLMKTITRFSEIMVKQKMCSLTEEMLLTLNLF